MTQRRKKNSAIKSVKRTARKLKKKYPDFKKQIKAEKKSLTSGIRKTTKRLRKKKPK